ncbi:MAG: ABC transporter ATP-binding protein [Rikenellaceae bacterium]|nr:ABC transporter ATP-binding protein [Rikenellaceae bacterium]
MIKASEIYKRFLTVEALRGVSLEVAQGEIVAIVGASGAGKSTLLQILGTLMAADSGRVEIAGKDCTTMGEKELAAFRNRHIGFVFQFHHLLPEFTALENVAMPALIGGAERKDAFSRAAELLDMVGLSERTTHKPVELSGGEQQRVAIARALINRPSVVLADEPTGNLDTASRDQIHSLLLDIRREFNQTIVMVTHDMSLADSVDRKIVMSDGAIL